MKNSNLEFASEDFAQSFHIAWQLTILMILEAHQKLYLLSEKKTSSQIKKHATQFE